MPEPWLRGSPGQIHPLISPLFHSFQQTREDLANCTAGLTDEEVWLRPDGLAPVGFQLKHIAGSVDRLATYLAGCQLNEHQMAELRSESDEEDTPGLSDLLHRIEAVFRRVEQQLRSLDPAALCEPRSVGRKGLPTTVAGLLVHIAEHTQRHAGEAIITAKIVKCAR